MSYAAIDPILLPWAARHKLHVMMEYKEDEVRSISIVDDAGDVYDLFVESPDEHGLVKIGVGLQSRAGRHTLHRERRRFTMTSKAQPLEAALESALERIHEWIAEAGHTRQAV